MWRLYEEYYDNVTYDLFRSDLAEKECVHLGFDAKDRSFSVVRGFSTAMVYSQEYQNEKVGVLFTGDSIFHPDYWGRQTAVHKSLMWTVLEWKLKNPTRQLYYLFPCSGCRTYLFMARNLPEHWPHFRHGLPERQRGLRDALARRKFGDAWKPERGVVSFGEKQAVLKGHVAPFTDEVRAMEEIQFFMKANPGFETGDELVIVAPLDFKFLRTFTWKLVKRAVRGRR
ncbi:hypothetical protein LVJ94_31685 [Pendulispora rubella]|uniref:GNAT family N-acetyltransferase n=1 Tax=Pendulispora rubella TaxID=2741070 RepID=A0ABZ2KUN8_9BACT